MHQIRLALLLLAVVVASFSGPPSLTASTFAKATVDKSAGQAAQSAQDYDLLLKGGRVIDSRNNLSAVRDVAIKDGKVAAVAADIPAAQAFKTVDVKGLYVTPGLIDIHAHTYRPTHGRGFTAENQAVYPDGFSFRNGVTTFVDPGGSGWRNFEDMKDKIIDRSRTRVLAMINIVGLGGAGGKYEQDLNDMEVKPTAEMALKYKGIIVGVKSAHYSGPEWDPFTRAVEVGRIADIPVMVDFGTSRPERPLYDLLNKVFRPGDIFTHVYGGNRGEQDPKTLGPSQALIDGRKRGVLFDVGHGGGSFRWRVAVPLMKAGFLPDTMSTDLHTRSMNAGLKDILNLMSKFLAMGMPIDKVIAANTWNAARAIKQEQLGHLSVGAAADVAVLRVEKGSFGFADQHGARLKGTERLRCELTLRDGKVVYDLNDLTGEDWDKLPADYRGLGDPRWDGITDGGGRGGRGEGRGRGEGTGRGGAH
jgi:dihydroorotase